MSETNTPSLLPERDYEAIESAVMETSRGRWFLAEYARRNRSADTALLLSAIRKLESALLEKQDGKTPGASDPASDQLRFDLMEMAATIAQTKLDIAAIAPQSGHSSHITTVTSELDSIVTATESATYEILQGTEGVQEMAWNMRQAGFDQRLCRELETRCTEIFAACEFQDLTGQRIAKVVQVLNYIEQRLNSMIDIWGDENLIAQAHLAPDLGTGDRPTQPGGAITQCDVDELMWTEPQRAGEESRDSEPDTASSDVHCGSPDSHDDDAAAGMAPVPDPAPSDQNNRDDWPAVSRRDLVALDQEARTALFC